MNRYAIAEVVNKTQNIKVDYEPMHDSDIMETVSNTKLIFPFKSRFESYSKAIIALDNINRKGIFTIVKINQK